MKRPRHYKIVDEMNKLGITINFITDGDIAGVLSVIGEKPKNDIYYSTGGGPEGVLAASAIDAYGCKFQGRFIFSTDQDKDRAKKMGIEDLNKKYELNEIIKGDSIFCATGITSTEMVAAVKKENTKFIRY